MSTEKQYYSSDEEDYSHETPQEAAEALWDSGEPKAGDVVTVWEGDASPKKASYYVPDVLELMQESAYEDGGDWADTWDFTKEQKESMQEAIERAVDAWADANDMHPKFYSILRSRPIKVRFINEDGDCEVVPENTEVCDAAAPRDSTNTKD
jgi:hypothetical protein